MTNISFRLFLTFLLAAAFVICSCCTGETPGTDPDDEIPGNDTLANTDTLNNPGTDTLIVEQPVTEMQTFVYVSLDADKQIAVYKLDSVSGKLEFIQKASTNGSVGSLASSRSNLFLYAALRSTNEVATYGIDSLTGKLRYIQRVSVTDNPVYICPDNTNNFLLTAYFTAGKMAIYPITGDSLIEATPTVNHVIGSEAHYIHPDAQNKFIYVALRGSDRVMQYSFDETSGTVNSLSPEYASSETGAGPRHMFFHPSLPCVYVVNEMGNTVTKYSHNSTSGILEMVNSISTLPSDWTGSNTTADIHITPDGKYLYASNRGHNSIAGYSIDNISGNLDFLGCYPTEPTPREFDIDPSGKFIIAGGQGSGKLVSYSIEEDGSLEEVETISAGSAVTWVLCVSVETRTMVAE